MRCSALRPCRPKASRSPRTSRIRLSAVTRPSPLPRSESSTSPVWHGSSRSAGVVDDALVVEPVELLARQVELVETGPARLDRELGLVLLGSQSDRRGLDAHRQVLGHERDVATLALEVQGDREDPAVVVAEPEARRAAPWGRCG